MATLLNNILVSYHPFYNLDLHGRFTCFAPLAERRVHQIYSHFCFIKGYKLLITQIKRYEYGSFYTRTNAQAVVRKYRFHISTTRTIVIYGYIYLIRI